MKLNRRDFLEFLGKIAIASGVVAVSGLPELADDPIEPEDGVSPARLAKWNDDAWLKLNESLGNPNFYQYSLVGNGIIGSPFKSISLTMRGKAGLVFRDEVNHIKLNDHIHIYKNDGTLWIGGWVTYTDGYVVNLENGAAIFNPSVKVSDRFTEVS